MREIRIKLQASPSRTKVVKKVCDHAPQLNRLETHLKSRENEYRSTKTELDEELRKKERELTTALQAIKSARSQSELIRK